MARFIDERRAGPIALLDAATDGASISPVGTIRGDDEAFPQL